MRRVGEGVKPALSNCMGTYHLSVNADCKMAAINPFEPGCIITSIIGSLVPSAGPDQPRTSMLTTKLFKHIADILPIFIFCIYVSGYVNGVTSPKRKTISE
jgi:hypothetical protein